MKKVIVRHRQRVFDGFFKIDAAEVSFEQFNGSMTPFVQRLCFERGDSVAALLYDSDHDRLMFVNQFRYPTYTKGPGWVTETMAGMVDGDESPENAVRREVREETGFEVKTIEHIATFYVSPGGSSERIALYYAEVSNHDRVSRGGGLATETEDIKIVEMTFQEALEGIRTGTIVDAKTILGIYWLKDRLHAKT